MRVRRLAVALAACCLQVRPAAADESINIFVAIDAAYYLGLVLCGMVRAYGEPSSAARRGRPFKFFVLHGPRLPATTVCAASEAALRCRAARPLNPKFGTDGDLARVETRRCRAGRARPTGADAHNSSTPTIPAGPASARPRRRDSRGPSTPSRSRAPAYRSWRLRRATLAHSRPSARSCNRLWRPRERESRAQATVPRALDAVHRLSREEAAANAHHCSRRGERVPAPFSLSPANPRSAPFQAREPPQPRAGRGRRVPSPAGCAASAAQAQRTHHTMSAQSARAAGPRPRRRRVARAKRLVAVRRRGAGRGKCRRAGTLARQVPVLHGGMEPRGSARACDSRSRPPRRRPAAVPRLCPACSGSRAVARRVPGARSTTSA